MKRKLLILALSVAMLALPLCAVSAAEPRLFVSGTFTGEGTGSTTLSQIGNSDNRILTIEDGTISFEGSIQGVASYDGSWLYIKFGTADQTVISRGHYTIEATVNEKEGGLYLEGFMNTGTTQPGLWRVIGGTGDLAKVTGQGTFEPTGGYLEYYYEGQLNLDP